MNMTDINLTLSIDEANALINLLNKDDALSRAHLINKIREQGAPQAESIEAAKAAEAPAAE